MIEVIKFSLTVNKSDSNRVIITKEEYFSESIEQSKLITATICTNKQFEAVTG